MTTTPPLDPVVAAAWGLAEPVRRGPKPALQLDEIVSAAMAVADAEGLAAVSMARVAKQLGYTTMSLYRYVQSKDELLVHMGDGALGRPDRSRAASTDWRAGLQEWTLSLLEQYTAHSWVVDIPVAGPPLMPRNVEWLDWGLSFLESTPLAPLEKVSTLLLLSGYVRNEVSLNVAMQQAHANRGASGEGDADEYPAQLGALVTAEALPALARLIDEGFLAPPADVGDEDDFILNFGLQRILDGLGALIGQRTRQRRR